MPKTILLNPGPVNIRESVRNALLKEDICHREEEFTLLLRSIRAKLLEVYNLDPKKYKVIILAGSGTAAIEASICSLVTQNKKFLVITNGVYGERMVEIARVYSIPTIKLSYEYGKRINIIEVEDILKKEALSMVAVVHHETTTGILNPLEEIGTLLKEYPGKFFMVDGISSFGGEVLDFEGWGIGVLVGTANKCLQSVPGCSFVVARQDILEQARREINPRSVYLNLLNYYHYQEEGTFPFTPPIQIMYALNQALDELLKEGIERRIERYRRLASMVRERAKGINLKTFLDGSLSSNILTSFHLPEGISYAYLHDVLKEKGFVIYAGQSGLSNKIFRIANMGEISESDIERLFEAIGEII